MKNNELKESFDRCEAAGDFAETFYDIFLASSPAIAPFFAETNFVKQRNLLRATVYILVTRMPDDPQARETLERIGQSHARTQLNVRPELYELWLDSVCATVEKLDPQWTPELETAWRAQLRPGIEVITSMY